MATIKGSIVLVDKFSPVLRSVVSAVNAAVNAMESCGTASTESMDAARAAIEDASAALDTFDSKSGSVGDGLGGVRSEAEEVTTELKKWNPALLNVSASVNLIKTGLSAVKAVWNGISGLLDASSTKSSAATQLGAVMANMGGTYEGYGQVVGTASALSQKTTFGDEAYLAGAAEIGTYLSDANAISALLPTLADYAAGMGGADISAEQMTQYASNLAKTFVGAFDAMNEKGFVFSDAQKEIMETGTEMEKVAVLADVIGESWGGLAETIAATPQGQITQFQNSLTDIKEMMGDELYPYVQDLIGVVVDNLPTIESMAQGVVSVLQSCISVVSGTIIPIVSSVVTWIQTNIEGIKSALLILAAVAASVGVAMAASWVAANAPLILLAMLIAQLVEYLNTCGTTANEIATYVGTVFGWLYAVIRNIFADIYNTVAAVAEFFMNVWNDPITAVQRLFFNLCDSVLSVLQTIANAIDAVFGTSLATGLGNFRSQLQTWVDEAIPENSIKVERMDKIDAADSMVSGADFVRGVVDDLDLSGIDSTASMIESMFGSGGGVKVEGVGSGGGSAVTTSGEVSLADEDLKYILDATERRYIAYVNLETAAPSIQVSFGDVRETADVDQIEEALVARLDAALPYMSPVGAGQEAYA